MSNIGQKSFVSALINVTSQGVNRLLGIISVIIIARILTPDDYGLVAIAQLSITFLQIILFSSASSYLVRKEKIEKDDLDTAWSIRMVLCCTITIILILSKENIATYFNDPRLQDVILCLTLGNLINGLENMGAILYVKKLEYKKIFLQRIVIKLTGFIVTVSIAIYLRNYWALISGLISMQIMTAISSYYFFEHSPRFTFKKLKSQWSFTKWVFLSNLTSFIRNKLDQLLISRYLGTSSLGFFNMTYQLTNMPYTEIVDPIQQVIYSSYSSVLEDKKKLANMFIQVVGIISIIAFPIYLGLLAVTEDVVLLILGEQWIYTINLFPWVILLLIAQTISVLASNMLTVLGKVKILSILNWLMVFIMVPVLFYIIQFKDLELFILGRASLSILFIPIIFIALFNYLTIQKTRLLFTLLRPMLAALIMYLAINNLAPLFTLIPVIPALLLKIIIGADIYIVTNIYLWIFSKKPLGGEEFILDKINFICQKNNISKKLIANDLRKIIK